MSPKSWTSISTGDLIKEVLFNHGESFVMQIHREMSARLDALGYKIPMYTSVSKMIYVLRKLGLVRRTRKESAIVATAKARQYYELVPGREDDPAWRNPYDALYHPALFAERTVFRETHTTEEWLEGTREMRR